MSSSSLAAGFSSARASEPATANIVDVVYPEYGLDAQLEVDDETHSDYGSSISSSTQSVTSSVKDYVYSNGRRYHRYGGEGKYVMPNDEAEQDRLDLAHHAYTMMLGGEIHTAPVHNAQLHQVLDCGTGTGIWALDFSDLHPEATVIGVDLSPIQPSWVYNNVKFEVDDLEMPWTWPENHFDFIHSREISLGMRDFPRYVEQMYKHTKKGGYIEIGEVEKTELYSQDGTYTPDCALHKYMDAFTSAGKKAGFKYLKGDEIVEIVKEAGFVDVVKKTIMVPYGPWPKKKELKDLGWVITGVLENGLEAYALNLLTTVGGYDGEEAKKICQDALKEVLGRKVHAFQLQHQVVGRKPTDDE